MQSPPWSEAVGGWWDLKQTEDTPIHHCRLQRFYPAVFILPHSPPFLVELLINWLLLCLSEWETLDQFIWSEKINFQFWYFRCLHFWAGSTLPSSSPLVASHVCRLFAPVVGGQSCQQMKVNRRHTDRSHLLPPLASHTKWRSIE